MVAPVPPSYGKCECGADATVRHRDGDKILGVFCISCAHKVEAEVSPWVLGLPVFKYSANTRTPPIRLRDGRVYPIDIDNPPFELLKYDLDVGSYVYRPKKRAWVRSDKPRIIPLRKQSFSDGAALGTYVIGAVERLRVSGGLLWLILRNVTPKGQLSTEIKVGLFWAPHQL